MKGKLPLNLVEARKTDGQVIVEGSEVPGDIQASEMILDASLEVALVPEMILVQALDPDRGSRPNIAALAKRMNSG